MDTIIHDLFFRELELNADTFIQDPDYLRARSIFSEVEALLTDRLSGKDRQDLLRLVDAHDMLTGFLSTEFFVRGFRLGGSLVADVLSTRYTSP